MKISVHILVNLFNICAAHAQNNILLNYYQPKLQKGKINDLK